MAKKLAFEFVKKFFEDNQCELLETEYKNSQQPMQYKCSCGNISKIAFNDFRKGGRCIKCRGKKISEKLKIPDEKIIELCEQYGCKFVKSFQNNNGKYKSKIIVYICKCGRKTQSYYTNFNKYHNCRFCGSEKRKIKNENYIQRCSEKWNNFYDYSITNYTGKNNKIKYICPEHGKIKQYPYRHYLNGCPFCSGRGISKHTKESFIEKANQIHNNKYNYDLVQFDGIHDKIKMICPIHGEFEQKACNHINSKQGCPKCGAEISESKGEIELKEQFKEYKTIYNDQSTGKEIDLYFPDYKLGVEYHGLYWHSELFQEKNYHLNKLKLAEKHNIQLLQFFEHEWQNKKDIVLSMIKSKLGVNNKIFARKCNLVKNVSKKDFLNNNHLQGNDTSKINYGLEYEGKLVALMTFGKFRFSKEDCWELIRYASLLNVNVIGGASRLLNAFTKEYPGKILTFANRRYSNGNLYKSLGFNFIGFTQVGYFYYNIKTKEILSRIACQKHKITQKGMENLKEHEIMAKQDFYRVWDCGNYKFELNDEQPTTKYDKIEKIIVPKKIKPIKLNAKFKPDYEYVKNYFKEQKCELLESEYFNAYTLMKYKCSCGNVSEISFSNFKYGKRCSECRKKRIAEKLRTSDEELIELCKQYECQFIRSYMAPCGKSQKLKIVYLCKCGKEKEVFYFYFKNHPYCSECKNGKE